MAAINAQQIKKIYAIGNALGIVERYNALIRRRSEEHTSELQSRE